MCTCTPELILNCGKDLSNYYMFWVYMPFIKPFKVREGTTGAVQLSNLQAISLRLNSEIILWIISVQSANIAFSQPCEP